MFCGWEGNQGFGIALTIHHWLLIYHLQALWPMTDVHHTYTPQDCDSFVFFWVTNVNACLPEVYLLEPLLLPFYRHYTGQALASTPVKNWMIFWSKVLPPICHCRWHLVHLDNGEDDRLLLNGVTCTISAPLHYLHTLNHQHIRKVCAVHSHHYYLKKFAWRTQCF